MTAVTAGVLVCAAAVISCGEHPAVTEGREATALVDSVADLPDVLAHAAPELGDARRSLATADSLMALDQQDLARMYYAEATVHARIAVVEAESAALLEEVGTNSE